LITGVLSCNMPQSTPSGILCTITLKTQSTESHMDDTREFSFNKQSSEYEFTLYMEIATDLKGNTEVDVQVIVTWEYEQTAQASDRPEYHWTKVYVPPYGYIGVSSIFTFDTILVDVGDWYELTLDIENLGNVDAEITLEVLNIPDDVEFTLSEYSFRLNSHRSKIVYGRLNQKKGGSKEFTFNIKADSDLPVEEPDKVYSFHVRTNEKPKISDSGPISIYVIYLFALFIFLMIIFGLILRRRKKSLNERLEEDIPGQDQ